jgi:hypothetical protein
MRSIKKPQLGISGNMPVMAKLAKITEDGAYEIILSVFLK